MQSEARKHNYGDTIFKIIFIWAYDFILLIMNYSTLEPYSSTTPLYDCEWKGQRSSKFPPTIRHLPAKDLIRISTSPMIKTLSYRIKPRDAVEGISTSRLVSKSLFVLRYTKCRPSSIGTCDRATFGLSISSLPRRLREQNKDIILKSTILKVWGRRVCVLFISLILGRSVSTGLRTGCRGRRGLTRCSCVGVFIRIWTSSSGDC